MRSLRPTLTGSPLPSYLFALAVGLLFVFWLFPADFILGVGPRWAAPGGNDVKQNVIGMRYFLADEWRFPLFQTQLVAPPEGINIISAVDCGQESASLHSRKLGEGELLVVLSPPLERAQVIQMPRFKSLCRSFASGFACSRQWSCLGMSALGPAFVKNKLGEPNRMHAIEAANPVSETRACPS